MEADTLEEDGEGFDGGGFFFDVEMVKVGFKEFAEAVFGEAEVVVGRFVQREDEASGEDEFSAGFEDAGDFFNSFKGVVKVFQHFRREHHVVAGVLDHVEVVGVGDDVRVDRSVNVHCGGVGEERFVGAAGRSEVEDLLVGFVFFEKRFQPFSGEFGGQAVGNPFFHSVVVKGASFY